MRSSCAKSRLASIVMVQICVASSEIVAWTSIAAPWRLAMSSSSASVGMRSGEGVAASSANTRSRVTALSGVAVAGRRFPTAAWLPRRKRPVGVRSALVVMAYFRVIAGIFREWFGAVLPEAPRQQGAKAAAPNRER